MTIYIDIVIIENLIMNYIILCATGIVSKNKIRHLRLIMASLLGAIYSVVAYMKILEIYSNIVLKILLSVIIVYIAYNPQTVKKLWKTLVMFYLVSFVFGGVAFSLIYIIKPQDIIMKNGLFLGTYPLKTIILGAIVAFAIIIIAVKIIRKKFTTKDMICDIEIMLNNKKINTKALIDTGNMLKEPITNTPVVVVEKILLYECIPKEILNNINQIIGGDLEKIPQQIQSQYISKLKLIPFSSLGKQNGMLLGIKVQQIKIIKESEEITKENIIVGIYQQSLTKNGEYQALMGMEFI
jgi:stage II sporulation protein GA (sporulation sigma-E factor processing peptidase)